MVCSADELAVWKDFPKGLRVLLLEEDGRSAIETKLKLEAMDYVVSLFFNEKEALEAISEKAESFHIAIVEVTSCDGSGNFRFLEMVRDLPTIVVSNVRCLSTVMKCIALGAAEFLQKPISEDKLRNIWQHVVHKAFSAGGNVASKSLKPIKETVVSMFQLESEASKLKDEIPAREADFKKMEANDKFPAPSTPQLEQGGRLSDDADFHDHPNCCLPGKESKEDAKSKCGKSTSSDSKSVDITSNKVIGVAGTKETLVSSPQVATTEEEMDSAHVSGSDECSAAREGTLPFHLRKRDNAESVAENPNKKKSCDQSNSNSHASKGNRKKMKMDWTPELHRQFVQAVDQLGLDQAIPSKILELMKVEGLTRHNVASHLQKYRMQRRHILPKEDDRRWQHQMQRGCRQRPLVPIPPYHCNYGYPPNQAYSAWGNPTYLHNSAVQIWSHVAFPPWPRPPETWSWRPYHGIPADAWGCPVVPPPYRHFPVPPLSSPLNNSLDSAGYTNKEPRDCHDSHLAEEVIDEVVKEAMDKPWLPLPLGLKPPSTDSVLAELHRQGIPTPLQYHCAK